MTRDELVELLAVERHTPLPERPEREPPEPEPVVWDDSDVTTARRRRELKDAINSHREGVAKWHVSGP